MIRCLVYVSVPALVLPLAASPVARLPTTTIDDDSNDGDDAGWTRYDLIGTVTGGTISSSYSLSGGNSYRI